MMLVSSSTLKRAPRIADFTSLVKGCDLLVIPAIPQTLATDALLLTQRLSRPKQLQKYRVLLTWFRRRQKRTAQNCEQPCSARTTLTGDLGRDTAGLKSVRDKLAVPNKHVADTKIAQRIFGTTTRPLT